MKKRIAAGVISGVAIPVIGMTGGAAHAVEFEPVRTIVSDTYTTGGVVVDGGRTIHCPKDRKCTIVIVEPAK